MKTYDYLSGLSDELVRNKFISVPKAYATEIASMLTKRTMRAVHVGSLSHDMFTRCLYID